MPPDRDAPTVLKAFAVGAVACPGHMGVHIDMVDEHQNIIATGFLDFYAWALVTAEVDEQMEAIGRDMMPKP